MVYKIAHLSDLHIDYCSTNKTNAQGLNIRYADGLLAFAQVVQQIIENEIDAVIISGDVFHTPKPSQSAIIFVQNQLRKLWKAKIKVYILAGNHDASDITTEIASSRVLHDPDRNIFSHIEPYIKYEINDGIFVHLISHHMYSAQSDTMKKVIPEKNGINILATHGSCIDPLLNIKLHTNQSPREVVIPDFLLNDYVWDYTMLGHIHERGWVGSKDGLTDTTKNKIFYNGSLIRRGFSDGEGKLGRGWTEWKVSEDGSFQHIFHNIQQRPQFDFPIIDASELTSIEITDKIIENLKNTQADPRNVVFDHRIAPMLRQKIVNIDPSKYNSLDHIAINNNAKHALSWKIDKINSGNNAVVNLNDVKNNKNSEAVKNNTDIIQIYDQWSKSSATLEKIDKNIAEKVNQQTRNFIEQGQKIVFAEE